MLSSAPFDASARSILPTERSTAVGPRRSRPAVGRQAAVGQRLARLAPVGRRADVRAHRHVRRDGVEARLVHPAADILVCSNKLAVAVGPAAAKASARSSSLPNFGARLISVWRRAPALRRSARSACEQIRGGHAALVEHRLFTAARLSATFATCTPCTPEKL